MTQSGVLSLWPVLAHVCVVAAVAVRVILTEHPPGSAFAWILLVAVFPLVGVIAYVLIGERPIGRERQQRAHRFFSELPARVARLLPGELTRPDSLGSPWEGLARLVQAATGMPPMGGSRLHLFGETESILRAIIADVEGARQSVDMAFYIWNPGGTADEVAEALGRAAARGVRCRVLLDALGSKVFLRSGWPARLRAAGVTVLAALEVKPWQIPFRRIDLRLHRKIVVVDRRVGYTGSMNLVDPRFFKQDAGVGEWVDAMVRIEGPAVLALLATFASDWGLQTGEPLPEYTGAQGAVLNAAGPGACVQVVPSGPGVEEWANLRVLVQAIAGARRQVVLTTPYFVADTALVLALENAAMRGVEVTLILPAKNDSVLVQYASRRYFDRLVAAGVRILQFDAGLLHTKSITVDDALSLFGTVNLDIRSMQLNFELMLAVYDPAFTRELVALQQGYARKSRPLDEAAWRARPVTERIKEGLAAVAAPLL
jgi:cardiolipin synthase